MFSASVFQTEFGPQLHSLLFIHIVQDRVPGFPPDFTLSFPSAAAHEGPSCTEDDDDEDETAQNHIQHSPLTVALSVSEVGPEQVLGPKWVTETQPGNMVTLSSS